MLCRAARHGLKLNGKLKRIQEQEQVQANNTSTASQDMSEASFRTSSDLVDPKCEKQSRKRRRTRDESVKKKKRLGV